MLRALRIKNLALVFDLTLELQPGFNAITGETGAGKSIIIGALNLVLGERADRALIRSGSDSCTVEAVFDAEKLRVPLQKFLEDNGLEPCEENQLVLKRIFSSAGANRQFINGTATTLQVLGQLGQWLGDMHGPHDHQSLFHPGHQLAILDAFGGLESLREKFSTLLGRRVALENQKAALIVDEHTYAQQLDLWRFQVNEIASAKLAADEEAGLEQEHGRASNAARLLELAQTALGQLSEDENALLTQAGALGKTMQELQRIDPGAGCLLSLHEQAVSALRDVLSDLTHYADRIDLDPKRLQQLEERLNLVQSLRRKYGPTLDDVIAFGENAQRQLQSLEQRDAELTRLNAELKALDSDLMKTGRDLSAQRRKVIPKLAKAVVGELRDLGFEQSHFEIALSPTADEANLKNISASGFDAIEFQFAPNPGEPTRALRAIASSGEMSRVMLALKTVLAGQDEIPVLVFDEIDANVGGETATVVGTKMREIARKHQVLCITHLPAVAASASAHYVVTKQVRDGRTVSEIHALEEQERVAEIARMLGGQGAAARQHAEAMLASK